MYQSQEVTHKTATLLADTRRLLFYYSKCDLFLENVVYVCEHF